MLTVSIVSILAVLIAFFGRDRKALICSFFLLTIFWALRYDWGNDYLQYLSHFNTIKSFNIGLFEFDQYDQLFEKSEYLWYIINNLFRPFGFFCLIIVLSIIENYILYKLVVKYIPPKWYWLSIFIYCFNMEFYLIGASMMRQWLALCLSAYALVFLLEKKIIPYIIISIAAYFIHFSALIMLLSIPFAYLQNVKIAKYLVSLFIFLFLWYLIAPIYLRQYAYLFFEFNEKGAYSTYEMTDLNDSGLSVFGVISNYLIPLIGFLMLYLNGGSKSRIIASVFILQLFFVPLGSVIPIFGRFTTYFAAVGIIAWPLALNEISKTKYYHLGLAVLFLLVILIIRGYVGFFSDPIWEEKYSTYTTILTQEWQ